jgi:hypothetical protein
MPMSVKIPRFEFRGLHGRMAACGLEKIDLADGRVVIIATELHDNPGVSITNFAEELAAIVCRQFEIDPKKLVWIEHYPPALCPICKGLGIDQRFDRTCHGCRGTGHRKEPDRFDRVMFALDPFGLLKAIGEPEWRPMAEADWKELGLPGG